MPANHWPLRNPSQLIAGVARSYNTTVTHWY